MIIYNMHIRKCKLSGDRIMPIVLTVNPCKSSSHGLLFFKTCKRSSHIKYSKRETTNQFECSPSQNFLHANSDSLVFTTSWELPQDAYTCLHHQKAHPLLRLIPHPLLSIRHHCNHYIVSFHSLLNHYIQGRYHFDHIQMLNSTQHCLRINSKIVCFVS